MALWGTRILTVGGNELATLDLVAVLQEAGAQVELVGSAKETLASLAAKVPDLLLVDTTIPGMDAHALLHTIRSFAPEAGGRVAAASVGPDAPLGCLLEAWRSAGFQLHVGKPVDRTELLAVAETLTGRRVERRRRRLLFSDWPGGVYCECRAS